MLKPLRSGKTLNVQGKICYGSASLIIWTLNDEESLMTFALDMGSRVGHPLKYQILMRNHSNCSISPGKVLDLEVDWG